MRETGFLRVAVRNRVFELNSNWEVNIVAKTRFLIVAGGQKKPGFFDKSKRGSKYCGKNPVSDLCAGGERNLLICARGLS